jgi:hypothetical protein
MADEFGGIAVARVGILGLFRAREAYPFDRSLST